MFSIIPPELGSGSKRSTNSGKVNLDARPSALFWGKFDSLSIERERETLCCMLNVSAAWINPKEFQGRFWAEEEGREERGDRGRQAGRQAGNAARDFPIGQL